MVARHLDSAGSSFRPRITPRKWTTQVNIAIAIAVLLLLVIGGVVAWSTWRQHRDNAPETSSAAAPAFLPVPIIPSSV
jgi:hypothetical protein